MGKGTWLQVVAAFGSGSILPDSPYLNNEEPRLRNSSLITIPIHTTIFESGVLFHSFHIQVCDS